MVKVNRVAKLLAVEIELDDSVIGCLRQLDPNRILTSLLYGQSQFEFVSGFSLNPPQVGVVAPLALEAGQVLLLRISGCFLKNLETLALERAFDLESFHGSPVADSLTYWSRLIRVLSSRREIPKRSRGIQSGT